MIEIFVHSRSSYFDVGLAREMSQHSYCAPGAAEALVSVLSSKFKNRILAQEDFTILEQCVTEARACHESFLIYDISRMSDRIKAIRRGIRKTPAAIIDGKKCQGLEEIQRALSLLH